MQKAPTRGKRRRSVEAETKEGGGEDKSVEAICEGRGA